MNKNTEVHPFEKAGLGKAPFHCTGMVEKTYQACDGAPVQPGSSCDFCMTAIRYCFLIEGIDGKQFKVGCDCVRKLGRIDNQLSAEVEAYRKSAEGQKRLAKREADRAKRLAKEAAEWEWAKGVVTRLDEARDTLKTKPHPYGFTDRQTGQPLTLLDYVEYLASSPCNNVKVAKAIAKAIEEKGAQS
jgi:hypothetical protein